MRDQTTLGMKSEGVGLFLCAEETAVTTWVNFALATSADLSVARGAG